MVVSFTRLTLYLDAVAGHPAAANIDDSPHGAFWRVDRDAFVVSNVPGVMCTLTAPSSAIPIVTPGDPDVSSLLLILSKDRAVCGKRQMPRRGPFVTDLGYSVTLADGEIVSGAQILGDLRDWIAAGCPR